MRGDLRFGWFEKLSGIGSSNNDRASANATVTVFDDFFFASDFAFDQFGHFHF